MIIKSLINLLPLLPLTVASPLATRQNTTTTPSRRISENTKAQITNLTQTLGVSGQVAAVVSGDYEEVLSWGSRDVLGNPINPETYWAIASNTKLFTAIAISFLIEDGVTYSKNGSQVKLSLDSLMQDVLPTFSMSNITVGNQTTLRDVMSMRTGLPQHILATHPTDDSYSALKHTPYLWINAPSGPNGTFQYSNHNYELLSAIPATLTGKTIHDIVHERIFQPLDLGATTDVTLTGEKSMAFLRGPPTNITLCISGLQDDSIKIWDPVCSGNPEAIDYWIEERSGGFYGGAGINLQGHDMIKWINALVKEPSPIPPSVIARIQTAFPTNNTETPNNASAIFESIGYQAGTVSAWYRGHKIYQHDGAVTGSNSFFIWCPEEKVGVFTASNDDAFSAIYNGNVATALLDDLLGLEPVPFLNATLKQLEEALLGGGGGESGSTDTSSSSTSSRSTGGSGIGGSSSSTNVTIIPPPSGFINRTYTNKAYGNITILPLNVSDPSSVESIGIPYDWASFAITSSGINITSPIYYTTYPSAFASHIIFNHYNGSLFNYTTINSKPRINKQGQVEGYVVKLFAIGGATFAEETNGTGIGIFGNFPVIGSGLPKPDAVVTNVKQVAPVFFDRV